MRQVGLHFYLGFSYSLNVAGKAISLLSSQRASNTLRMLLKGSLKAFSIIFHHVVAFIWPLHVYSLEAICLCFMLLRLKIKTAVEKFKSHLSFLYPTMNF
jgi:hypothetical protein